MAAVSRIVRNYRFVWLCLDFSRSTPAALDRTHGLSMSYCHYHFGIYLSTVHYMIANKSLFPLRVSFITQLTSILALLCFSHGRKWLRLRFPGRYRSHVLDATFRERGKKESPGVGRHYSYVPRICCYHSCLSHLLERTNYSSQLQVCNVLGHR